MPSSVEPRWGYWSNDANGRPPAISAQDLYPVQRFWEVDNGQRIVHVANMVAFDAPKRIQLPQLGKAYADKGYATFFQSVYVGDILRWSYTGRLYRVVETHGKEACTDGTYRYTVTILEGLPHSDLKLSSFPVLNRLWFARQRLTT